MHTPVKEFLSQVKVGAKQSHKNMTLYCLLSVHEAPVDFLTLDEALERGALAITEVNEGGSVQELKVANKSDHKILLLDGEELVGAKQNRVLNVTILVAPQSETVIPVSCVEQGRWSYRSREFGSAHRAMSAKLKRRKSETVAMNLRHGLNFRSDQGMVWEGITHQFCCLGAAPSPTMAMADLYESCKDLTKEYLKAFHPVDKQIGMVVFIDGQVAGLEFLANFRAFGKTSSKLVNSYVVDALETAESKAKPRLKPSKKRVSQFLEFDARTSVEKRDSVGLGHDLRLKSKELIGAGLELDGEIIQLSVFCDGSG